MHHTSFTRGRRSALALAAVLLLALCLLAVGAQALTDSPALVINEPGRYTLDHDLSSDSSIGVLINSSDVVFDGMGHSIEGTGNGTGVLASGTADPVTGDAIANVTVRNLTVRHWSTGISGGWLTGSVVEDVVAEQNGVGLDYSGLFTQGVVRDSVFRENTGAGIYLDYPADGIAVERCRATGNGDGLVTFDSGRFDSAANRIDGCDFSGNTGTGLFISEGHFSGVGNSTISGNGGDGVRIVKSYTTFSNNRIEENGGTGVDAGDRSSSTITGNWIQGNGVGVRTDTEFGFGIWNNVLNNTVNGYISTSAGGRLNVTQTAGPNIVGGPFIGGNVWAFPNGTGFSQTHPDTNGDGFCDEPFATVDGATDYLPLALQNGTPTPTPTPTPAFGGSPLKPLLVPGRIQAEDYNWGGEGTAYHDTTPGNSGGTYRHDDVDIENTPGLATPNIGWIRNGEYLTYTANVTTAGAYTLTARVASPNSGRTIAVSDGGGTTVATITVPNTGSFATFKDVGVPITLGAGTSVFRLTFAGDGQNLDWIEFTPVTTPPPQQNGTPFTPLAIPGIVQAENYDLGGEGVAYHDTTPGNTGGAFRHDDVDIETGGSNYDVGWVRDGEFLTYTVNVATTADYYTSLRVASPNSNCQVDVSFDGGRSISYRVPNTGSFDTYTTATLGSTPCPNTWMTVTQTPTPMATGIVDQVIAVRLTAGTHVLRLGFHGDGQNLDWIAFGTGPGTTPPTPPAGSGASFVAVPTTAAHGSAVKFTVTPASGKSVASAWWSFDAPAHLNTWNSRTVNPTFFYPSSGTFSPLVKIIYTDGSTETVQRTGYITAT